MNHYFRDSIRAACYVLAVFTLACAPQPAPDTRAADEAAIREADIAWSKAAAAKQVDEFVAYFADDASAFPPNAPIATGKEAIRESVAQHFEMPGFAVSWQAAKVEAARSGDLGFSQGTFEMTFNDPKGNPVMDRGKYVTVWKKQADGSWKAVADIFNSDLPASGAPAQ